MRKGMALLDVLMAVGLLMLIGIILVAAGRSFFYSIDSEHVLNMRTYALSELNRLEDTCKSNPNYTDSQTVKIDGVDTSVKETCQQVNNLVKITVRLSDTKQNNIVEESYVSLK